MSTNSSTTQYVNYLSWLAEQFNYCYFLSIMPIGLVGNLISIYIYSRPSLNKKTNTGFLYIWLCLLNMFSVLWFAFVFRSSALINYTFSFPCGVEVLVRRANFMSVAWIQVLISFDRYIAVVFPNLTFMRKRV